MKTQILNSEKAVSEKEILAFAERAKLKLPQESIAD